LKLNAAVKQKIQHMIPKEGKAQAVVGFAGPSEFELASSSSGTTVMHTNLMERCPK
jgi:hypothetical protein